MSYCRVSEGYWNDDVIRALTEPARYFMLYLMTCQHGNRLGLFVLAPAYAAEDLDCEDSPWTDERVEYTLEELHEKGRIGWDRPNRIVFVRYYLRHNVLLNASVVKGALNDLAGLPKTRLFGELLETVIAERRGEGGQPIRAHYAELEDELRKRCRAAGIKMPHQEQIGLDTDKSHNEPHNEPHNDGHNADQALRAGAGALPSLTVPSPTLPDLSHPPRTGRGEHADGNREDVDTIEQEIRDHLPTARANIIGIHGSERAVWIGGHKVGVGIEIDAFRRLCRERRDPPEIIAAAIAHLPAVSGLEPPVSLARWSAEDGNPIYEQCVGLAYKGEPGIDVPLDELQEALLERAAEAEEEASP